MNLNRKKVQLCPLYLIFYSGFSITVMAVITG